MPRDNDAEDGHNHVAAIEVALREILEISEMIDLVSADQDSCMRFRRLRRRLRTLYVTRVAALVMMVEEHSLDIYDQLLALIRDS
jgi:hypothetical protein